MCLGLALGRASGPQPLAFTCCPGYSRPCTFLPLTFLLETLHRFLLHCDHWYLLLGDGGRKQAYREAEQINEEFLAQHFPIGLHFPAEASVASIHRKQGCALGIRERSSWEPRVWMCPGLCGMCEVGQCLGLQLLSCVGVHVGVRGMLALGWEVWFTHWLPLPPACTVGLGPRSCLLP